MDINHKNRKDSDIIEISNGSNGISKEKKIEQLVMSGWKILPESCSVTSIIAYFSLQYTSNAKY